MAWTTKERSGPCECSTTLLLVRAVEVCSGRHSSTEQLLFFPSCLQIRRRREKKEYEEEFGEEEQGEPYLSLPPLSLEQPWLFAVLVWNSYGASMIFLACFHVRVILQSGIVTY